MHHAVVWWMKFKDGFKSVGWREHCGGDGGARVVKEVGIKFLQRFRKTYSYRIRDTHAFTCSLICRIHTH